MVPAKKYKIKMDRLLPVVLALLCMVLPLITIAQGPPDTEDTPIDGGVGLLIAAGAVYGVKKYKDVKNARKENS